MGCESHREVVDVPEGRVIWRPGNLLAVQMICVAARGQTCCIAPFLFSLPITRWGANYPKSIRVETSTLRTNRTRYH